MANFDWHKIMFLESSGNLKPLIKSRTGRYPNTTIAREIAVCLQQGRLFYDAATNAPPEIKPLQLFYGMVGFAKALVVSSRLCALESLTQAHGLSDVSSQNSRICDLKIKIGSKGTFQEFNDTMSDLNRITFIDDETKPSAIYIPTSKSDELVAIEMSLKDILSRIPMVERLYKNTFKQDNPNTESYQLSFNKRYGKDCVTLRIDDGEMFSDVDTLRNIVTKWRSRFPFLQKWILIHAEFTWGKSIITFANVENTGAEEFDVKFYNRSNNTYQNDSDPRHSTISKLIDFSTILDPPAGGYSESCYAIAPINNKHISEFSLHYMALYLLSSLVRYRPQTWGHALSRSGSKEFPPDDEMLALIERFMVLNQNLIPNMVSTVINPYEDNYPNPQRKH